MGLFSTFKTFCKNYSLVLKVMLTQVVMLAAGIGVLYVTFSGVVSDVGGQLEASGLITKVDEILIEVGSYNYSANEIMRLIGELGITFQYWGELVELGIGGFYYRLSLYSFVFFAWLIILRFLNGLARFPLNQNLNESLGSSYKSPFSWQYFRCIGKSAKQQLLSLIYEFLSDVVILFATLGLYALVFVYTGIWGLIAVFFIFSALVSFRQTITAFWLPEAVNNPEAKIHASLRKGVQKVMPCFGRVYLKNFLVFTFTLTVIVLSLVSLKVTVVSATICVVVFAHNNIFQSYISMTEYFKATDRKFYPQYETGVPAEAPKVDEGNEFS